MIIYQTTTECCTYDISCLSNHFLSISDRLKKRSGMIKSDLISNPNLTTSTKRMCQHCGKKSVCRPRSLCTSCFASLEIRNLYPPKIKPKIAPPPNLKLLELPDFQKEGYRCCHGLVDGECPTCEREQRSKLIPEEEWIEVLDDGVFIIHNSRKRKWNRS